MEGKLCSKATIWKQSCEPLHEARMAFLSHSQAVDNVALGNGSELLIQREWSRKNAGSLRHLRRMAIDRCGDSLLDMG
jgi:hypothetical protein